MTETSNSDQIVQLTDVRLSYFYGHEPYTDTDAAGKPTISYCSHFIFAPNSPNVAKVKAAQRAAAIAMWKDGAEAMLAALAGQDRLCLHQGDISKPGQDGYAGMLYVSGNSKKRFTIVDGDRSPLTAADGRPYSGCYANAIINVWAQNNKWGKRINAQIAGVQFLRHGESFGGGRVAAPEEFGAVSADGADGAPPGNGAASGLF
jgi:hypothetical protein